MRRFAISLVSLLLTAGFVVAFPSLASAHDILQKTTPADGATLTTMPSTVSLQFSEPPLAIGTQVLVKGPSGDVADGKPTIEGSTVVQAVSPDAPAGSYTVTYRVTSDDGHPVGGTFVFSTSTGRDGSTATPTSTSTAAAGATPTTGQTGAVAGASAPDVAPVANESSSFVPVLLAVVGVLVVIALGAFFVLRGRRQG